MLTEAPEVISALYAVRFLAVLEAEFVERQAGEVRSHSSGPKAVTLVTINVILNAVEGIGDKPGPL